jgi:diguanylate cyclase (GGDEF)-like protein
MKPGSNPHLTGNQFMAKKQEPVSERGSLKNFLLWISLAISVSISCGFLGMFLRDWALIHQEMRERARAEFRAIVQTRRWNAGYGGVYVEKKAGVVSNPYLVDPDIRSTDGRVFTKKNPALMTREISELVGKTEGHAFHITSLNPLNPHNVPDAQETEALRSFENGVKEAFWEQQVGDRKHLRYMAPLLVEASCLDCHAAQGYKVGQVRGGISVSFDIHNVQQKLRTNVYVIAGLALLTIGLLLLMVMFLWHHLVRRLAETRKLLEELATTDPLTGLMNRRHLMQRFEEECERQRRKGDGLACLLLDIDRFKKINDMLGHQEGDKVLVGLSGVLRRVVRPYDLLGRFGGEEFLILLPHTNQATARIVAERIRQAIRNELSIPTVGADPQPVTASLGLTLWTPEDTLETVIHRADTALYRAKAAGRDRIEIEE